MNSSIDDRVERLIAAFKYDGYAVDRTADVLLCGEKIGIRATHTTAVIGATGKKKKIYYLEGDPHTMGYLQGKLAEPDIERMCTDFNENIVFDFINVQIKDPAIRKILGEILEDIIYWISKGIYQDIPPEYAEELEGMLDGCKEVHKQTRVDRERLWVLNVGIDAILSYVYTGLLPHKKLFPFEIKPEFLRVPIMCNGFSVTGVDSRIQSRFHYLGRDFMFPNAGVFQDTASMIIRKPDYGIPTACVAAPGMIGAIAGLSINRIGVGVDMSPASNCSTIRPGLNSLLLTRHSIQYGKSCDEAVNVIATAQRGVSWNYFLADGITDKACVLEAGVSVDALDVLSYTDYWVIDTLKEIEPDIEDMVQNPSAPLHNGCMIRWNTYTYPVIYQKFNQALIEAYKKRVPHYSYTYNAEDFTRVGFLNKKWTDRNCPGPFYFAPQREDYPGMVLLTNHYITPEMRFCAMNTWTTIVASGNLDDLQWRYDELNSQLLAIMEKGYITIDEAREAIDFLSPQEKYPEYYNSGKKPLNEVEIHGSVSLMDLKKKTIESHYGYFSDEWITITLGNYV
jgi:hypothetical protein